MLAVQTTYLPYLRLVPKIRTPPSICRKGGVRGRGNEVPLQKETIVRYGQRPGSVAETGGSNLLHMLLGAPVRGPCRAKLQGSHL